MTDDIRGRAVAASLSVALLFPGWTTADVAGSADYPGIGRFQGAEITQFSVEDYGKTVLATGPVRRDSDAENTTLSVEGRITRIFYAVPKGASTLEVFRNFEARAAEAGFETIFSGGPEEINDYVFKYGHPVEILREERLGNGFHYLAAVKDAPEAKTHLSILVAPHGGGQGPRVGLIAAEARQMAMRMVDAEEMGASIADTGRIALYGIHFDHDSEQIRPESKGTLDEIARLMADRKELKIIVVGHTDYTGGYEYNMDLSRRRARAVTRALVDEYGIAGARLKSDGVGYLAPVATNRTEAGRAQNRRVELVEEK